MKRYLHLTMISVMVIASACNKDSVDTSTYTATVNVINAIPSPAADIKMNFTSGKIIYADATNLGYFYFDGRFTNGAMTFGVPTGAVPLSIALAKDTTKPIFTNTITCQPRDIYSIFVAGEFDSPTAILVKDTIVSYKDSISGVRFVNLSPNVGAVSINISGTPVGSEVASLPYKGITSFMRYPAKSDNENYLFEIHDAVTGDFLTAFFYSDIARFNNVTLVIRGFVWGDPGLEVVRFNNY